MVTCRGLKFRDEDDAFEHFRQREIDAAADVQRAFFAGKEAGRLMARAGMNPHEVLTPEYDAWERGRSTIEAQRLSEELERTKSARRASCDPCTCGGRGICRDAA